VNCLYSGNPEQPGGHGLLNNLLDAYLLATRYRAHGLLDLITDSVREFTMENVIGFELLDSTIWRHTLELVQQRRLAHVVAPLPLHRPENCKVNIYLVQKDCMDINNRGIDAVERSHPGLGPFLPDNTYSLEKCSIRELARLARDGRGPDPATTQGLK